MNDINTQLKKSKYWAWLVMFVLVFIIGGFLSFKKVSGAIIASGVVAVEGNLQVVQHATGGVIEKIHVRNGDIVVQNQPLISLSDDEILPDLQIVESNLFEALARQSRLKAIEGGSETILFPDILLKAAHKHPLVNTMVQNQERLFTKSRDENAKIITGLKEQEKGLQARLNALEEQLKLVKLTLTTKRKLLSNGNGLMRDLDISLQEHASLAGQKGEVEASIAEVRVNMAIHEMSVITNAGIELQEVGPGVTELTERRAQLTKSLAQLQLLAPVSGIVYQSKADTIGAVITPAEPVLYIVPSESALIISARVGANDVDKIFVGQSTRLHFSAFDRNTPEIAGNVNKVSAASITDDGGQAFYEVDIEIDTIERELLGDNNLLPGMLVDAFITTGEQTYMSYLLTPLTNHLNRAMRES